MQTSKIKIVMIDNESRALNRMKILLKHFPEVDILEQTTEAQDGLDYILQHEPDLAFLDVEMPGITGLEIADELRKNGSPTKVVFFTAYDHYAITAIKKSAFDYLLKPVSIDELKDTIQRFKVTAQSNLSKREF